MRITKTALTVMALAIVIMALPAAGLAAGSEKTVVAFTQPVAIPGMVLQPGAYVFKTSSVDNHVVLVYDGSESQLLTTLPTISAYRVDVSTKPLVLEEGAAGSPQTLREWFASGELAGREFIYSASESGK